MNSGNIHLAFSSSKGEVTSSNAASILGNLSGFSSFKVSSIFRLSLLQATRKSSDVAFAMFCTVVCVSLFSSLTFRRYFPAISTSGSYHHWSCCVEIFLVNGPLQNFHVKGLGWDLVMCNSNNPQPHLNCY